MTTSLPYNPDAYNTPGVEVSPLSIHALVPNQKVPIGTWAELWFGSSSHLDPGYSSKDPITIATQVKNILGRGFDFLVLDWYGPNVQPQHDSAMLLKAECEKQGLPFIIDYNQAIFQFGVPTGVDLVPYGYSAMSYAVKNFCSSPAYMKTADGRFLMCCWQAQSKVDMSKIAPAFPQVALIYDGSTGASKPASAGMFGWVGVDNSNQQGSIEAYQTSFLAAANKVKLANPKLLVVPSMPKGFDDHGRRSNLDPTKSCWDQKAPYRFADEKQGQTLLNVAAIINSTKTPIDYILVPTWNDYEENTAIERGIDTQLTIATMLNVGVLTTILVGNLNSVARVDVTVNGNTASYAPKPSIVIDLNMLHPSDGDSFTCSAVAVGKPSMQDKRSNVVKTTLRLLPSQPVQLMYTGSVEVVIPDTLTVDVPEQSVNAEVNPATLQEGDLTLTVAGTVPVTIPACQKQVSVNPQQTVTVQNQPATAIIPAQTIWL